jgi:hypothetical protein
MNSKIRYQIFTGPMDEDWLVAELLYEKEHFGDIVEWGDKIILYPRNNREPWKFPIDELVETITLARKQVSREMMRKTDKNEPERKK